MQQRINDSKHWPFFLSFFLCLAMFSSLPCES
jgi:hypothetical protein